MKTDLKEWCERLETLTHGGPTESRRKEVEEALASKWEGVQVWAGRVLASWGDRTSADLIRGWLQSTLTKEAGWAVRGEAIRAMCRCYEADDIPWLLDLYFKTEDRLLRHEFLPFITALPKDRVVRRLAEEQRSTSPIRREAATIAGRVLAPPPTTPEQKPSKRRIRKGRSR